MKLECPLAWLQQAPQALQPDLELHLSDFPALLACRLETLERLFPWREALQQLDGA